MSTAVVALGANLGDPMAAFRFARDAINAIPNTEITHFSSIYGSAAREVAHAQPDYTNAVCVLRTESAPKVLLDHLLRIEGEFGRTRNGWHASRSLDLDLIDFDGITMNSPELTLPHPRAHLRAFVLMPLAEIAPKVQIGAWGTAAQLLETVRDQRIRKIGSL